jgi:hypothetical protein
MELSRVKTVNIMGLVRATNSTYIEVNRNIKILEKEGVVTDQHLGRMRMLKLNCENQKTILLLQALKILSKPSRTETPSKDLSSPIDGHQAATLL